MQPVSPRLALVTSFLLVCSTSAQAEQVETKAARIIIYGAFGTPASVTVSGRVVEDPPDEGQRDRGAIANLTATLHVLETDEVRGVPVTADLNGIQAKTITDDDGLFFFRFRPKKKLAPGNAPLRLTVQSPEHHAGVFAGAALIVPDTASVGIVSDFDDTLVNTYVANKAKLAFEILTKNAAQLTPIPGGAAAFNRAQEAGAAAFFYVSSSPQSFADRVRAFLDAQGFPRGAILLKNYGSEKLFAHHGYKTRRIEALLEAFPNMQFILVGDSGEADPVIYRDLRRSHPGRVAAIVIRRASDKKLPEGLEDAHFFENYLGKAELFGDLVTKSIASKTPEQKLDASDHPIDGPAPFFFGATAVNR